MKVKAYYDRPWDTVDGFLTIQKDDGSGEKIFDRLHVRSGQTAWSDTSWVRGKSPCPPGLFNLNTSPNNRGQRAGRRGVGEFFPIDNQGDRYTIKSKNGNLVRTEVGLHEENDWYGSEGCLVVVVSHEWIALSDYLRSLNVDTIPLEVLR